MDIHDITKELPRHTKLRYATRKLLDITRIVIHHSGTKTGTPLGFAKYHVLHCGWPGIAYHYVITAGGTVYKTQPITAITYHARGANVDSIGICLVGDFSRRFPPDKQMAALKALVAELKANIPYKLAVVLHKNIKGSKTSCPGALFPNVEEWRAK